MHSTEALPSQIACSKMQGQGLEYSYSRGVTLRNDGICSLQLVEHVETNLVYACKSVSTETQEAVREVEVEVDAMTRVARHLNIVTLHEVFKEREATHLVMDLCPGGDVCDYLLGNQSRPESTTAFIFWQVAQALAHCHARRVVHRDVKPEKMLVASVTKDWHGQRRMLVKLGGFNTAVCLRPGERAAGVVGSAAYLAPEVCQRQPYGCEADMWSFGVSLFCALAGYFPFPKVDLSSEAAWNGPTARPKYKPRVWSTISDEALDLVQSLLLVDPSARMTAEAVLRHPWITQHRPPRESSLRNLFLNRKHLERLSLTLEQAKSRTAETARKTSRDSNQDFLRRAVSLDEGFQVSHAATSSRRLVPYHSTDGFQQATEERELRNQGRQPPSMASGLVIDTSSAHNAFQDISPRSCQLFRHISPRSTHSQQSSAQIWPKGISPKDANRCQWSTGQSPSWSPYSAALPPPSPSSSRGASPRSSFEAQQRALALDPSSQRTCSRKIVSRLVEYKDNDVPLAVVCCLPPNFTAPPTLDWFDGTQPNTFNHPMGTEDFKSVQKHASHGKPRFPPMPISVLEEDTEGINDFASEELYLSPVEVHSGAVTGDDLPVAPVITTGTSIQLASYRLPLPHLEDSNAADMQHFLNDVPTGNVVIASPTSHRAALAVRGPSLDEADLSPTPLATVLSSVPSGALEREAFCKKVASDSPARRLARARLRHPFSETSPYNSLSSSSSIATSLSESAATLLQSLPSDAEFSFPSIDSIQSAQASCSPTSRSALRRKKIVPKLLPSAQSLPSNTSRQGGTANSGVEISTPMSASTFLQYANPQHFSSSSWDRNSAATSPSSASCESYNTDTFSEDFTPTSAGSIPFIKLQTRSSRPSTPGPSF
eukprot:TRINITY_DN1021_c0_g2_i2.p1 TRINITY_DN1021_c0_g2~~TRINITY_DN1021_c0_g2_i2.p1  ORF type:complete len:885 (-),score=82.46 TRINITY_DN1021_c0_g2_i2:1001-3655(-)